MVHKGLNNVIKQRQALVLKLFRCLIEVLIVVLGNDVKYCGNDCVRDSAASGESVRPAYVVVIVRTRRWLGDVSVDFYWPQLAPAAILSRHCIVSRVSRPAPSCVDGGGLDARPPSAYHK